MEHLVANFDVSVLMIILDTLINNLRGLVGKLLSTGTRLQCKNCHDNFLFPYGPYHVTCDKGLLTIANGISNRYFEYWPDRFFPFFFVTVVYGESGVWSR